jgi:VWFA-related protein
MSRKLAVLLLAASTLAIPSQSADVLTFRTEINLVKVDVKVSDSHGTNHTGLSQGDFLVFDENEPRQITHFNRDTEPLDLVLLLDVSNSMTPSLTAMAARTREALAQLHPGDRVALLLFSTRSEIAQPFTTDFHQIQNRILDSIYKRSLGSSTLMNEALVNAAGSLNPEPRTSRRAILIVTDNQSARQTTTDDQVSRALSDTDAILYAMLVGNAPHPPPAGRYTNPAGAPPDVFQYTSRTGGEVIGGANPGDAFRKIIEKILTRFTLDYAAPTAEPGAYRHIRIELTPDAKRRYPDAKIEAREGYYVKK